MPFIELIFMSDTPPEAEGRAADELLPPVEPPNPGFIFQLFVVPGVIVSIILVGALLLKWLSPIGDDPRGYYEALKRSGPSRWQAAANLADALRGPRHKEFKRDRTAARELAQILDDQLDEASMDEKPVTLRIFLCRALGEFEVDDGIATLLRAAQKNDHPLDSEILATLDSTADSADLPPEVALYLGEANVRRSAIEAIALLSQKLREANPPQELAHEDLIPALTELATDASPLVRSATAFALGVLNFERLKDSQHQLLADPNADVRYNAAVGLARTGDEAAIDVLLEMLDPDQQAGMELEKQPAMRQQKQALIMINALRAVRQLIAANPEVEKERLIAAIRNAIDYQDTGDQQSPQQLPRQITLEATNVLRDIEADKL